MLRRRRTPIFCSNCNKEVPYGSYHCRGNDELNAYWTCTEMPEVGPPGPASVSPKEPDVRQKTEAELIGDTNAAIFEFYASIGLRGSFPGVTIPIAALPLLRARWLNEEK